MMSDQTKIERLRAELVHDLSIPVQALNVVLEKWSNMDDETRDLLQETLNRLRQIQNHYRLES